MNLLSDGILPLPRGAATRVLGVFAHPDDESYLAGGTLAAYVAAGCAVRLVTLTAGEAGVVGTTAALAAQRSADAAASGTAAIDEAARSGLARYATACSALAVKDFGLAAAGRWRDLGAGADPGSPAAADLASVVAVVKESLTAFGPDVVLTNDADGVTRNPDHIRAHDAVVAAIEELEASGPGTRPLTLRGCVRAADVRRAVEVLGHLTPARPIGNGGITGVPDDACLVEIRLSPQAVRARQGALDSYGEGLGSQPLRALVHEDRPVGDGVLLRAISDLAGPDRELFRPLVPDDRRP